MVNEKEWKEFRESGLLWFINQTLHVFGWAIVVEVLNDEIVRAYPARVKFRGFSEESSTKGYQNVSKYLQQNIDDSLQEYGLFYPLPS